MKFEARNIGCSATVGVALVGETVVGETGPYPFGFDSAAIEAAKAMFSAGRTVQVGTRRGRIVEVIGAEARVRCEEIGMVRVSLDSMRSV